MKRLFLSFLFLLASTLASAENNVSVFLEDMTWQEVAECLQKGEDSVIIPTGGTEQNGPHMALGKHNSIVKYTSEKIARKLGNTLVAPVVVYTPEGDIKNKEGHMAFAGTISLRQSSFEAVLEDVARSLLAHGFKRVYFVGDSGDNQAAQKKIAAKLSKEYQKTGQRVFQIDDYYYKNLQTDFLKQKGFEESEIGTHAAVRDTSELLFVESRQVRESERMRAGNDPELGSNGNPSKASSQLGRELLELKIKAACEQITHLENQS